MVKWVGREAASALMVIAFVVGLATFPPLIVLREPTGYKWLIDTAQWAQNLGAYWQTLRSGSLGLDVRGNPAAPAVAEGLARSLTLVAIALTLAVVLGVLRGFWDFHQLQRRQVAIGPVVTGALQGLPDFWVILVLQFGAGWLWRHTGWQPFRAAWDDTAPLASLIFPVVALTLVPLAHVARITCTALVEVYRQDYIRTARAKGVSEPLVVYKHALRNAAVQLLDGLAGVVAVLFSNLLIVEYLFGYPGLTPLLKQAMDLTGGTPTRAQLFGVFKETSANVPTLVLAGVALGILFSLIYLSLGILRRVIDPRLKEGGQV